MGFSQILRDLRTEKNLTQKELATRLGLSPNSICEWEKGRCEPGIAQLNTLSQLFECSIDYLTGNSDDFGVISIQTKRSAELTPDEKEIIENFRKLSPDLMHRASTYMQKLVELENEDIFPVVPKNKKSN